MPDSTEILSDSQQKSISQKGRLIHPSQDFDLDYGCYTIPTRVPDPDGKQEPLKTRFVLVTDSREIIDADDREELFKKHRFAFKTTPQGLLTDRWALCDIERFNKEIKTIDAYRTFQDLTSVLGKYVEFKDAEWYHVVALWIMGTYIFRVFEAYPYLAITGFRGSGKSKTAEIISRLAFNGLSTVGISEASLFRIVEATGATLIIDEGEQLMDKNKAQTLRELLNAGYRKGSKVYRQEKTKTGGFETRGFDPYSPKVIVNIAGLEEVLGSRTIAITMLRSNTDKGKKIVTDHGDNWEVLRSSLYAFGLEKFQEIRVSYNYSPDVQIANNRDNELWSPLIAVGKVVFKDHPEELDGIREFAKKQIETTKHDSGLDTITHALILGMDRLIQKDDWYANKELVRATKTYLESDEEIKSSDIGFRLKRLGFQEKKRENSGIKYHLTPEDIKEIMERFDLP